MPFHAWSEAMSVGVPLLDEDHKVLIRLISRLHDTVAAGATPARLAEIFDGLIAYYEFHFAREERILEACGYPDLVVHREQHVGFTRHIHELRQRAVVHPNPAIGGDLLDYLKDWLNHHVLIHDMAYKPYVAGNPRVAKVARALGRGLAAGPPASTPTP